MPKFSRFSLNYIKSKTRSGTLHWFVGVVLHLDRFLLKPWPTLQGVALAWSAEWAFRRYMYDFLASMNEIETFQHEEDSRCDVIANVDLVNSLWSDTKTGGATRVLTEIKETV